MTSLTDYLDLWDWSAGVKSGRITQLVADFPVQGNIVMRGLTFTLKPSGKSSTTGHNGLIREIEIPLLIAPDTALATSFGAGDPLVTSEQAIQTKVRQIKRGAGAGSLAQSVFLWLRMQNTSHLGYFACQDANWQPIVPLTSTTQAIVGILTLECLPYAFGDPVYDAASATLAPTSSSIYRSAIPGDHEAAPRLWILDQSGNSKQAQQWTIYGRSIDGMAAGDWPPSYGLTAVSPATQVSDTAAYNGTRAHLASVTNSWQNVGYAQSGSGAFETQEALLKWRVRDTAAVIGVPTSLSVATAAGSGNIGGGLWQYMVADVDSGGHIGPLSGLIPVEVSGVPTVSLTITVTDTAETGTFALSLGGASTPAIVPGASAADIQALLCNLSTVGNGGATVTGTAPVNEVQTFTAPSTSSAVITLYFRGKSASYTVNGSGYPTTNNAWQIFFDGILGAGNSTVTGGVGGSTVTVTFIGALRGQPMPLLLLNGGAVTRSTTGAVGGPYTISFSTGLVSAGTLLTAASSLTADSSTVAIAYATPNNLNTNTVTWVNGANAATTAVWYIGPTNIWYKKTLGLVTSYSHTSPTDGAANSPPPFTAPPVQNTLLRVGVGLTLAEAEQNAKSAAAFPTVVANNEWEYLTGRTESLPNSVIPEGQIAPPWFAVLQAMNPGTATAPSLDADQMAPLPKDGAAVTVSCPLTLARPAWVQLDDRRDHRISALWGDTTTITASGNEITDATRTGALGGDGKTIPGGYGIWQAATNLALQSNHLNTTPWTQMGGASVSEGATTDPYGGLTGNLSTFLNAGPEQATYQDITVSASTQYTFSFFARAGTRSANQYNVLDNTHGGTSIPGAVVPYHSQLNTSTYTRISYTFTTPSGCTSVRIMPDDQSFSGGGTTAFWGVQLEAGGLSTPVINTTTTTASRSAARVQLPASLITAAQGWVAFGVEMDWASSSAGQSPAVFFVWSSGSGIDSGTFYALRYSQSGQNWSMRTSAVDALVGDSFSSGATRVLCGSWNSSQLALSVNGGTFTTSAYSAVPTGLASTFDIGTDGAGLDHYSDARFLWVMTGTGTLSQADATALGALTGRCPTPDDVSAAAAWTAIWNCRTGRVALNTPLAFGTFAGSLRAGPTTTLAALPEFWDASGNVVSDVQDAAWTMQARYLPQLEFLRGAN